jgi:hypothetical protein
VTNGNEHHRAAIRRALPADLDLVAAITDAAYTHYIFRLGRKPQLMLTDYRPLIAANEVWLLELESQPIGVLVLKHNPDHIFITWRSARIIKNVASGDNCWIGRSSMPCAMGTRISRCIPMC